jgi:NAD(P)H dehydrogenase (quinone)
MILVTASTGQLGREVLGQLLDRVAPGSIAAMARDPARVADVAARGVEVRQGDYTDHASLVRAFRGIDKLLFISTPALEGIAEQHANALNAAKQAGVRHVVYTSMVCRSATPRLWLVSEYRRTEQQLIGSGLAYTIMQNGYYMDLLPTFIGKALETGELRHPAGQGKANLTARSDLAEAAANILTGDGHEYRVYETCGASAYTFYDIAVALSGVARKRIEYIDIPTAEFAANLRQAGLPPLEVELMVGIAESIKADDANCQTPALEMLLGRPPVTLTEFLSRTFVSQRL